MASKKKILYKLNQNSIDLDQLRSPCLPIDHSVELKEIPTTGAEYLLKTIKEREQYAEISVCDRDLLKYARKQTYFVEEIPKAKAPCNLKPSIECQNILVADFSDVRIYVSKQLALKGDWSKGKSKLERIPKSRNTWIKLFETTEPRLTWVLSLPYATLDSALEVIIGMLDAVTPGSTIGHKTGQWIYSIIASIRQPLVSDTISTLRSLVRKCAEIRSHLNPDDEDIIAKVAPLNVFICLISRYFGQYDLAD